MINKFLTISLFCILAFYHLGAQILPKENSKLNYRLIGFSFPAKRGVHTYKVEIATGNYTDDASFQKNLVTSYSGDNNKIIGIVPAFGQEYTWRGVYTNKNGGQTNGPLYHFSTLLVPRVDTNISRLRIITNTGAYKDAYLLADGTGILYDMTGKPLWYLPDSGGNAYQSLNLLDLHLSPLGTLTYIHIDEAYEVGYNGDILWQAPNKDKATGLKKEFYHHEFTRLANGDYMALSKEYVSLQLPASSPASVVATGKGITLDSNNSMHQDLVFGTLIEYDGKGNVVWKWKSSDYAQQCDLYNRQTANWRYDINDIHENSFFFDEQEKVIYLGFKNIDRIIKIKYPEGNVLATYGEIFQPGAKAKGNNLFCGQHSCRTAADGNLYLFNNNECNSPQLPKLLVMKQPVNPGDTLQKIWEYQCTMDELNGKTLKTNPFNMGSNVFQLPGGEMFANMSSKRYNEAFIVSKDKRILWSAIFEQLAPGSTDRWISVVPNYRISIITDRKALEKLIWNQEM